MLSSLWVVVHVGIALVEVDVEELLRGPSMVCHTLTAGTAQATPSCTLIGLSHAFDKRLKVASLVEKRRSWALMLVVAQMLWCGSTIHHF